MQPGLGRPCSAEASQTATMLPSAVAFIYFYAMTTMSFLPLAKSKGSQLLQKVTCLGSKYTQEVYRVAWALRSRLRSPATASAASP